MTSAKKPTDVALYKRLLANNEDRAAFETLYHRFNAPPCDGKIIVERKGDNLVDWVVRKHCIKRYDAEDIVADCWAFFIINKPPIAKCFRAFFYQKLKWLIADYWEKRRRPGQRKSPEGQEAAKGPQKAKKESEEKPWLMPWRAKTNKFRCPGAEPSKVVSRAENTAALRDERIRSRQHTYFLDLAIMQEAMTHLSPEEQQTLRWYWLESRTLDEAAVAAGTTFGTFRGQKEKVEEHLCQEFFRIRYFTETLEDQTTLLSQWGDIRTDLHWLPDGENQECDCSKCEQTRREATSHRLILSAPDVDVFVAGRITVYFTDYYGYKLPGRKVEATLFSVGDDLVAEVGTYYGQRGWRFVDTLSSFMVA